MQSTLGRRRALMLAPVLVLAACEQQRPPAAPPRIYVRDFAVSPSDITLDSGTRGRPPPPPGAAGEQRLAGPRAIAAALSVSLVENLGSTGIPVSRIRPGDLPERGSVIVDGRLLAVQQGRSTPPQLIGLGLGRGGMLAEAKLYALDGGGAPRFLESFSSSTGNGSAPADDLAEAQRLGAAMGEQIKRYFVQRGWAR